MLLIILIFLQEELLIANLIHTFFPAINQLILFTNTYQGTLYKHQHQKIFIKTISYLQLKNILKRTIMLRWGGADLCQLKMSLQILVLFQNQSLTGYFHIK